ncbi:MAG: choice-of-anchor Q domain-containing protein [bacterium]
MKKQTDSACRISGVADSVSRVGYRVSCTPLARRPKSSIFNLQSSILALLLLAGTAKAGDYYVSTTGLDSNTGADWANALLTISNGVAKATADGSGTVTVSNGTYAITVQITISAAITVCSFGNGVTGGLANAAATVVRYTPATRSGVFSITANANLQGFTIQEGKGVNGVYINGGGVYMNNGVVRDCIIQSNGGDSLRGGGVYMDGGLVRDCLIRSNGNADRTEGSGVYINSGGTVSNCVISGNYAANGAVGGGGVYMAAGTVVACRINDNLCGANAAGAGVQIAGGTVRNCLITRNGTGGTGGGVYVSGGTIESCTITANSAGSSGGGGIYRSGSNAGTIRNCIVVNNTSTHATYQNTYSGTTTWNNNCTTNPVVAGTGCISGDPLFRDTTEGNYQLSVGSPCIDTGQDQGWMPGATDLSGNARKQDIPGVGTASVDMGAYEYNAALTCDFLASPRALIAAPFTYQSYGPAPFTVQFTGWADGTNLTGLVYRWDFDNDGTYDDESSGSSVSYTYNAVGVYHPRLQVINAASEVATKSKTNYVSAGTTHYVVTNNPTAAAPYTSWATAASNNIQAALNAATVNGSQVLVSNGIYAITNTLAVNKIVTLRSFAGGLSGASNTIIRPLVTGGYRLFSVSDANAVLQGFTIQDALVFGVNVNGQGVYMSAGLVRDCIIRNNGFCDNHFGSGVYMSGGTVSNCVVKNNGGGSNVQGAGIYATGGQILDCQILDNVLSGGEGSSAGGAGIYAIGALIRNCLIARNSAGGTAGGDKAGGGVYLQNGTIESCTIVGNSAIGAVGGGGVYRTSGTAGTILNCIVYSNAAPNNATYKNFFTYTDAGITYTCTTNPVVAGTGCIPDDPLFFNPDAGDFSLKKTSLCIDAGLNQTWMTGATDLAGNNRLIKGNKAGVVIVDMGAYETFVPARGTVIVMW